MGGEDKLRKVLNLGPKKFSGRARKLDENDASTGKPSSSGKQPRSEDATPTPQRSQGPQGGWAFRGSARTLAEEESSAAVTGKTRAPSQQPEQPSTDILPALPRGCGTGAPDADEGLQRLLLNKDSGSARTLSRMCANVINEPASERYRTLKLSNAKVSSSLRACGNAGFALLRFVGFQYSRTIAHPSPAAAADVNSKDKSGPTGEAEAQENDSDEEECLYLPRAGDEEDLARTNVALDSLGAVLEALGEQRMRAGPPPGPNNRFERAFAPSEACTARMGEMPESFYEMSADELKEELKKQKEKAEVDQIVASKGAKERMIRQRIDDNASSCKGRAGPTEATIRVRMPDGLIAQATFDGKEDIGALLDWVSNVTSDQRTEGFKLSLAGKRIDILSRDTKLSEAHLVPGGLLNMAWNPPSSAPSGPSLRSHLAQKAKPLE